MLSGEEMLRDKKGVHNSFNSPDSVNVLPWQNMRRHPEVFTYYRDLIALRRQHPAFRLGSAEKVRQHLSFLPTRECLVGFRLSGHAGGDSWQDIYVILNANAESMRVSLPEDTYTVVTRDGLINERGLGECHGGEVTVSPQSALILHN